MFQIRSFFGTSGEVREYCWRNDIVIEADVFLKKVTDAQVIRYCLQQFKILISLTSELDGFVLLNKPVKKLLSRHLGHEIDQSILGFLRPSCLIIW